MENEQIRLSKILSQRGMCSRREADGFIEEGKVLVDGQIISTLGIKVSPNATISFLPEVQKKQSAKVTILLNKPIGYVSTQPEKDYSAAIDLIKPQNQIIKDKQFHPSHLRKLSVAGRLDIDSKGLLVLSQDGTIAKQLIGPLSHIEKEYLVRVQGKITEDILSQLRFGLFIDGKALKSAKVDILKPNLLRLILQEGKKRQIRRMCEMVGLQVLYLKRVRVGRIHLGNLPEGKWRYLRKEEHF